MARRWTAKQQALAFVAAVICFASWHAYETTCLRTYVSASAKWQAGRRRAPEALALREVDAPQQAPAENRSVVAPPVMTLAGLKSSEVDPWEALNAWPLQAVNEDAIEVCVVAPNPRQGSIFKTNFMGLIGSGRYTFRVTKTITGCPWKAPRVRMIPYVKCCNTLAEVWRAVTASFKPYDITIVTGDEWCRVKSSGKFHFRQYHGDHTIGKGGVSKLDALPIPLYMPLGPRHEFVRVPPASVQPPAQRKYTVNFVGSPTSESRRALRDYFLTDDWKASELAQESFVHVTDSWTTTVDTKKGYITPEKYREVLLDSIFTLCPAGHNPEAFRMYEACEAGSIPVVVTGDEEYTTHECSHAYKPFIDSGAPFIFLDSWDDLATFKERFASNSTALLERQRALRAWYARFMQSTARDFERLLEFRYKQRVGCPLSADALTSPGVVQ